VIMEQAISDFRDRFTRLEGEHDDHVGALVAILHDCFRLTDQEIQRNRVLVAEHGLLALRRASPREEQARQAARERSRDLEFAWASFLTRAMAQGTIPAGDPRLLTRAILGLYNSVWHWYRPDGSIALAGASDFYVGRLLALVGVAPGAIERKAA